MKGKPNPPRETTQERARRLAREARRSFDEFEARLDRADLVGRVPYRPNLDSSIGRVDATTVETLARARVEYLRDPTAIGPLYNAVATLFGCALTRAAYGVVAPQWPAWLVIALNNHFLDQLCDDADRPRRGRAGRHAKEVRRHVEDRRDLERAKAVQAGLDAGLTPYAAAKAASQEIKGRAAGSRQVMEQAYKRVRARFPRETWRYQ